MRTDPFITFVMREDDVTAALFGESGAAQKQVTVQVRQALALPHSPVIIETRQQRADIPGQGGCQTVFLFRGCADRFRSTLPDVSRGWRWHSSGV